MPVGTLYGAPPSRASRVMWLAQEIGVELDVKPVNIMAGEHKSPEFAGINALQQVPAFSDGTVSIGESLAITLYLARTHPGDPCPKSPAEDAAMLQWTMIAAGLDPQMAPIMTHRVMLPEDKRDNCAVDMTMRGVKRALAGTERYLADGNEWLVGGRFTVADLNLAGATSILHFTGLAADVGSAFAAWLARCLDRPAAKAVMMPPMAPPPEMVDRIMKMLADA
jgi:glutathione S-transferase